jgi:hypothetical protein
MNDVLKPFSRWRWVRRLLVGALALLIITAIGRFAWWHYTYAQGQKELAAAIAETEASDPRWRWEQIEEDWPEVPDAANSILLLNRFEESAQQWNTDSIGTPDGKKLLPDEINNRQLDEERLEILRVELAEHQPVVDLAISFKDYPRGRAKVVLETNPLNTTLPHVVKCRKAAFVLILDTERVLHSGRTSDAWQRVVAILNCGAGMKDEPFFIAQLPRMSLRMQAARRVERILALATATATATEEELLVIQKRLEKELAEDLLTPAFRGERATFAIFLENLESGRIPLSELSTDKGRSPETWDGVLSWTLYKAKMPAERAHHLRTMHEMIDIAHLPTHEQIPRMDSFSLRFLTEGARARENKELLFSTLMLPAVDKVVEAAVREKAILSCAIAAVATERYRLANNAWPKTLEELCPKYLASITLDPFNGQSLKVPVHALT